MDLGIHEEIIWHACNLALARGGLEEDPRPYMPLMARGSFIVDVRQGSIVFDAIEKNGPNYALRGLLVKLWHMRRQNIFAALKGRWNAPSEVVSRAAKLIEPDDALSDFGSYNKYDHLDVTDDKLVGIKEDFGALDEEAFFKTNDLGRGATVHRAMDEHVPKRAQASLIASSGAPFDWQNISTFGQAAHMVADFGAHTNHAELLLWSLAWQGRLDPDIVTNFNRHAAEHAASSDQLRSAGCPLPDATNVAHATRSNTMFCYRSTPRDTPLVSSVFTKIDTAHSLMSYYGHHLKNAYQEMPDAKYKEQIEQRLDLIMAVNSFTLPPITKEVLPIYVEAASWLRKAGQVARQFLAKRVRECSVLIPAQTATLDLAAACIESVSMKDVQKWSSGELYKGAAYQLERHIVEKELDFHSEPIESRKFRLPHHAVLRKDDDTSEYTTSAHKKTVTLNAYRHRISCLIAVAATAELIRWRFSKARHSENPSERLRRFSAHPWIQIDNGWLGNPDALARLIARTVNLGEWQGLVQDGLAEVLP